MNIRISQFEGPLDLLLQLIEKQKLELSEISLAEVTDQYLHFVQKNKTLPFTHIIYFVEIASKLVMLKSRLLLPYLELHEDDDEESDPLLLRLKEYKHILHYSKRIMRMFQNSKSRMFSAQASEFRKHNATPFYEATACKKTITPQTLRDRISKIETPQDAPFQQTTLKRIFNIQEKIAGVINALQNAQQTTFSKLITTNKTKSEIIVSFLALLELCKIKTINIQQPSLFGDIVVEKVPL